MISYLQTMLSGLRQWITAQKADWNQNDDTAANYIKGRPCYDTDQKMEYLAKDQEVTLETGGFPDGWAGTELEQPFAHEAGKTYTVTWDGKLYSVVGQTVGGIRVLGNKVPIGGDDTGEPFCLAIMPSETLGIAGLGAGSHTFSVATMMPGETVPLPDKYLPATIQRVGAPVILSDASGAKWRLTVGTDGSLTTEAVTE